MKINTINLYDNLKFIRKRNKLDQNTVAQWLGISQPMYSKIENGFNAPSYEMLRILSERLGYHMDDLVNKRIRPDTVRKPAPKAIPKDNTQQNQKNIKGDNYQVASGTFTGNINDPQQEPLFHNDLKPDNLVLTDILKVLIRLQVDFNVMTENIIKLEGEIRKKMQT